MTFNLGYKPPWRDEVETMEIISSLLEDSSITSFFNIIQHKPPLYVYSFYLIFNILEPNVYNIRMVSVIFGAISLLLIFKITSTLINRKTGLISAFLLAINALFISFSQEATSYIFFLMLTLLSTYYFIKIYHQKQSVSIILYSISTLLMLYTSYLAIFIILAQIVFIILFYRTYRPLIGKLLIVYISISLVFLPWVIFVIRTTPAVSPPLPLKLIFPSVYCSYLDPFYTFSGGLLLTTARIFEMPFNKSLFGLFFNHSFVDLFYMGKAEFLLSITFLTLIITGLMSFRKDGGPKKKNFLWFLLTWLMLPLIFRSFVFSPGYCDIRYVLACLPPFIILVSNGIGKIKTNIIRSIIIAIIIILSGPIFLKYYFVYSESMSIGPYWQIGQFIPGNATTKEIAEYISFNSQPSLFPYIKIQKDIFRYINKEYPNAIILTDSVTSFKLSSPIHGWVNEHLTTLNTNQSIGDTDSDEFDLILKITGDGFDYLKGDVVEKALNKFNVSLIKKQQYYNMSVEIYKNLEG